VAGPWALVIVEDFRTPQVEGRRPAGFGLICRYIDGVHRVKRFFEVASLLAPPASLLAPEIVWRVRNPVSLPRSVEEQRACRTGASSSHVTFVIGKNVEAGLYDLCLELGYMMPIGSINLLANLKQLELLTVTAGFDRSSPPRWTEP
jgi:hypothetical protein